MQQCCQEVVQYLQIWLSCQSRLKDKRLSDNDSEQHNEYWEAYKIIFLTISAYVINKLFQPLQNQMIAVRQANTNPVQ